MTLFTTSKFAMTSIVATTSRDSASTTALTSIFSSVATSSTDSSTTDVSDKTSPVSSTMTTTAVTDKNRPTSTFTTNKTTSTTPSTSSNLTSHLLSDVTNSTTSTSSSVKTEVRTGITKSITNAGPTQSKQSSATTNVTPKTTTRSTPISREAAKSASSSFSTTAIRTSKPLSTSSAATPKPVMTSPVSILHSSTKGTTRFKGITAVVSGGLVSPSPSPEDNCNTVIGNAVGVSIAVIFVISCVFLVLYIRTRQKWRQKLKTERHKTDVWSMATFNNTIINDNFQDYQLASSNPKRPPSNSSGRSSSSLDFNFDGHIQIRGDNPTLRRNTLSAPDGLAHSIRSAVNSGKESTQIRDSWFNKSFDGRDRSSTFTTGKKYKTDRHVLLTHEEELDGTTFAQLSVLRGIPENTDRVTEL